MEGVELNKGDKQVKFVINSLLYPKDAVVQTASEFVGDCWLTVNDNSKDKNQLVVEMKLKKENESLDELINSFLDFLTAYSLNKEDEEVL